MLAAACAKHRVQLLTFSSDLVFDGLRDRPYVETDGAAPLGVYGLSKARAEHDVALAYPHALIVRTSACFSSWDDQNFVMRALHTLERGESFEAAGDLVISPTYVPDLVHAALDLLVDAESGIWHIANAGHVTWAQLAIRAAALAHVDASRLECRPCNRLQYVARRPSYSVLGSVRGTLLPCLEDALSRFVHQWQLQRPGKERSVACAS